MCTYAEARSRLLAPGATDHLDVWFKTVVDGPGQHGEVINIYSNGNPRGDRRVSVGFVITAVGR